MDLIPSLIGHHLVYEGQQGVWQRCQVLTYSMYRGCISARPESGVSRLSSASGGGGGGGCSGSSVQSALQRGGCSAEVLSAGAAQPLLCAARLIAAAADWPPLARFWWKGSLREAVCHIRHVHAVSSPGLGHMIGTTTQSADVHTKAMDGTHKKMTVQHGFRLFIFVDVPASWPPDHWQSECSVSEDD